MESTAGIQPTPVWFQNIILVRYRLLDKLFCFKIWYDPYFRCLHLAPSWWNQTHVSGIQLPICDSCLCKTRFDEIFPTTRPFVRQFFWQQACLCHNFLCDSLFDDNHVCATRLFVRHGFLNRMLCRKRRFGQFSNFPIDGQYWRWPNWS